MMGQEAAAWDKFPRIEAEQLSNWASSRHRLRRRQICSSDGSGRFALLSRSNQHHWLLACWVLALCSIGPRVPICTVFALISTPKFFFGKPALCCLFGHLPLISHHPCVTFKCVTSEVCWSHNFCGNRRQHFFNSPTSLARPSVHKHSFGVIFLFALHRL